MTDDARGGKGNAAGDHPKIGMTKPRGDKSHEDLAGAGVGELDVGDDQFTSVEYCSASQCHWPVPSSRLKMIAWARK
jgi:hypothetical protein